jgi:hypothetical protein
MDEVALAPPWLVRIIKCITDNGKGSGPHDKRYKQVSLKARGRVSRWMHKELG